MGCLGYDFGHAGGGIAGGGSRGNLDGLANYASAAHLCHGKYGSHHSTFVLVAKCNSQVSTVRRTYSQSVKVSQSVMRVKQTILNKGGNDELVRMETAHIILMFVRGMYTEN